MRTIGVLGGMGPAAGADFVSRLVATCASPRDQDHPEVILYSATRIADRTAFLLGTGEDPTGGLVRAVQRLEAAGVDFIVVPCNSAHAFLEAMRRAVEVPVLDLIAVAVDATRHQAPAARKVGVLAASGTVKVGLYDGPLRRAGLEPLVPEPDLQERVMAAIREVKGGAAGDRPALVEAAGALADAGADVVLMACTEVPLGLSDSASPVPTVDANQALVDVTLACALGRLDPGDTPGMPVVARPDGR